MITVEKELKAKKVRGRRYRNPSAVPVLVVMLIPAVMLWAVLVASKPSMQTPFAMILLGMAVLALPVAILLLYSEVSCIFTEDRLYFFRAELRLIRKRTKVFRTSGWLERGDVREMRYIPAHFGGMHWNGRLRIASWFCPPQVTLVGEEFEVTVYAFRSLIKMIGRWQEEAAERNREA